MAGGGVVQGCVPPGEASKLVWSAQDPEESSLLHGGRAPPEQMLSDEAEPRAL